MASPVELNLDFSVYGPAASSFIWSPVPGVEGVIEKCAMGERATGKTSAGIGSITHHAMRMPKECRPIPWVITRDTWTNIERTVLESFLNPYPNSFEAQIRSALRVKDGGRFLELPGFWYAHLFGMDSLKDLDKLRMQLGGLWVEEPAPAAVEDIGGGVDETVVTLGKSSLRHSCPWRVCQVTMNYPDEEHWTWKRYGADKLPSGRFLFRIKKGENPAIGDDYYEQMAIDFADNQGLLDRLVHGRPAFIVQGEKVTPEYDPEIHRAKVQLEPYPGLRGYRFWDGGHNTTCILAQITPRGQLHIFRHSLVGVNTGAWQLINDYLKPILKEYYKMIPEWVDIGDPSMAYKEQSDISQSAAMIINRELKTTFMGGPSAWNTRLQAVKYALLKKIDKGSDYELPFLQICPNEKHLHRALRGGWHYKKEAGGRVLASEGGVKDYHSHPGDALSHALPLVLNTARSGILDYVGRGNRIRVITEYAPFDL